MKKLLFFLFALGISNLLFAQAPSIICYQGVATNASGAELVNTNIGIRASFLKGSSSGTVVYTETHDATTDQFGLFTLDLGSKPTAGNDLSKVDWGKGPYFLKIEMAVPKGGSYKDIGTSQLLSVPYALNAGRATSASYADSTRVASNDKDTDPTNELQALSYDTASGKLKLVSAKDPIGSLEVSVKDADSDPKNEIQTLKFDPNTGVLTISDAGGNKNGEVNTREGLFSQPGASPIYPQGIIGTYRFVKESETYTVPVGKTLYITSSGNSDDKMEIVTPTGLPYILLTWAHGPVLPGGTKIKNSTFTGFEVPESPKVQAVIIDLKSPYAIPPNKILFIKSGIGIGNNTLLVDDSLTSFYSVNNGSQIVTIPGGINGLTIKNAIGVPSVLTGFLLDMF
jgi:hypothetical protein